MFDRLTFSVTFPATGETLSDDLKLEPGLTAITGPNMSGKSLRLEFLRYALFGTAALRGSVEDYQDLEVGLRLTVGSQAYHVQRDGKHVSITRRHTDNEELLATGHRAVNAKVREILGFGLDVFDVACAVNQGDVERLGAMAPAERKRMVDSTIGLDALDEVAKACAEEASGLRKRAGGILEGAVRPDEPEAPEHYCPSDKLEPIVEALRADQRRLTRAEAFLAMPMREPEEPRQPCEGTVEELELVVAGRRAIEEKLIRAKAWLSVMPVYPDDNPDPDVMATQLLLWGQFQAAEKIRREIDKLHAKGVNRCPKCHHQWPAEQARIGDLEADLKELGDVSFRTRKPHFTRSDVEKVRHALGCVRERAEREAVLDGLEEALRLTPDRSADLQALRDHHAAVARYIVDFTEYHAWRSKAEEAKVTAADLTHVPDHLKRGEERLREAKIHESLLASYQASLQRYEQAIELASGLEDEAEEWVKARTLLAEVRRRVKRHLCPLLSAAASRMVRRMSGGKLAEVLVDDDFEITVDGRKLCLLSGAGKAIANLAVRLGLGQVLTQGVLPVLLLDEPDAAMDGDNAASCAEFVRGLRSSGIRQILLVTHKRPAEADRYVEL